MSLSHPAIELSIPVSGGLFINGTLFNPADSVGLVIFAHGSGSNRFSPRNRLVADELNRRQLATMLLDLLTEEEDKDYAKRFDIALLTQRLLAATHCARLAKETRTLQIGYFGASTGAAAALQAAAALGSEIQTVVSRGGRPDLASHRDMAQIQCPVLFLVGELDTEVLQLNRDVARTLGSHAKLIVIAGATHLFEEHGCLEEVARLSADWFVRHLKSA